MAFSRSEMMADGPIKDILPKLSKAGVAQWKNTPVLLKSRVESHVYVSGREELTEEVEVLLELCELIGKQTQAYTKELPVSRGGRKICYIGLPTAGTALAMGAAVYNINTPFMMNSCFRIMREVRKGHGAHNFWVNGKPDNGDYVYVTVDNVITTGTSILEGIERLREDGYAVEDVLHIVVIDRQQGGLESLVARGIKVEALFNLLDLVWAFGELNLWPKDRVKAVEIEIEAHKSRDL
ncbi:MAG: hypothetical protein JWN64_291 [Parcubacteria group bacterium]|nr:hypothetical protein [Parcubacteria group bacterium]